MSVPSSQPAQSEPASVTIFATPKRFEGHIGVIQRNAIGSWIRLNPRPEVILFGTDAGTAEIATEFGIRHVPHVKCNEWGTPLVSDLFAQAESLTSTGALCYVNADILLLDDFMRAVARVRSWGKQFLMVGRRTDVEVKASIDFQDSDWAAKVRTHARQDGHLQIARSIDYFVFSRGLYPAMPPLAIGRFWWDNWLLWKARSLGAKVVDASKAVLAIHQNHDYSHTSYGPSKEEMMASVECIRNARLTCEANPADYDDGFFWRYAYTIDDATFKLTSAGIAGNPRHLWKQFKRYSSRPLGIAKLAQRALFTPARGTQSKNAVPGNPAK
jgi:hypothetical protein